MKLNIILIFLFFWPRKRKNSLFLGLILRFSNLNVLHKDLLMQDWGSGWAQTLPILHNNRHRGNCRHVGAWNSLHPKVFMKWQLYWMSGAWTIRWNWSVGAIKNLINYQTYLTFNKNSGSCQLCCVVILLLSDLT